MRGDLRHFVKEVAAPNGVVAIAIASAMLLAFIIRLSHGTAFMVDAVLLVSIGIGSVTLGADLVRQLLKGNFSVDLLAALSIGTAIALREYWVAAIVILMLSGGRSLEEFATRRASSVLNALAGRMPRVAHWLNADGTASDIQISDIAVNDRVVLHPHELCPVDGVVVSGHGNMDESYLTGEPFQIPKAPGAAVMSGAINGNTALTIEATKLAVDSRYARIVQVLHASEEKRPKIRRLADRLSIWYTPAAVAIALASWLFTGQPERFLSVLVVATPCPLLIAIPVAIIGAISVGARRGIVIKDPSILEKIDSCRALIVDKTGTLTYGAPTLANAAGYGGWDPDDVIRLAASLEKYSKHPLAAAVVEASEAKRLVTAIPDEVSESAGEGLKGELEGHRVLLTGRSNLKSAIAQMLPPAVAGLECVVLIDDQLAGVLQFRDKPRRDSKPFLRHLGTKHNIESVVLLSGDRVSEVSLFAAAMGIPTSYGGKSPEDKLEIVRQMTASTPTLYLGDGINDAPAMMNATVGVALGVNSEITSEAAGAVIMQASLASVDELIHIGRRMRHIALVSAVGGMLLSVGGMVAASAGYLPPIEGALLQEGIDLLAILNSLRMILPTQKLSDFQSGMSEQRKSVPAQQTGNPLAGVNRPA